MVSEEPKTYMPLFIGDYLADTSDLLAEEHGAYLLLLMAMWRRGGSLPADPDRLCRIAAVPSRRWRVVWTVIGGYFDEHDGHITQKRLASELEAARDRKAAFLERAQHAARQRWARQQAPDAPSSASSNAPSMPEAVPEAVPEAMLEAMLEQCPSTSTSTSSSTSAVETIRFDSIRLDAAAGVVMSYWNDLTERCWCAESADGAYLRERLRDGHSADTCCLVVEAAVASGIQHPRQAFSRERFGSLLATRRDPGRWAELADRFDAVLERCAERTA